VTETEPVAVVVYCDAESHSTPIGPMLRPDADAQLRASDVAVLGRYVRAEGTDGWTLASDSARRVGRRSRTEYRSVRAGQLRCPDCYDQVLVNTTNFTADLNWIAAQGYSATSLVGLRAARRRLA